MSDSEKVAEEFSQIYHHEWREARETLSNDKHEEEIIYLLMRIVRGIQDMCAEIDRNKKHKHQSTDLLTKEYIHNRLPTSLHPEQISNPLQSFIHKCVKCISTLSSLSDPLEIFWIPKGEAIDSAMFESEIGKSGQVCDWTVWPAVVTKDGSVVRKGIVIPV